MCSETKLHTHTTELVIFLLAVTNLLDKQQLKDGRAYFALSLRMQSIMAGETWYHKKGIADHMAPEFRKQRER